MTPQDAVADAVRRLRGIAYDTEKLAQIAQDGVLGVALDEWETPDDIERTRKALCRGYVAHALRDAWDLSDEPKPFLRMLVGPYKRGQWHAMLELKIGDERTWADVQKGEISPPEWFSAFSPQYAYQWGPIPGGMGFGRRWKLTEQT